MSVRNDSGGRSIVPTWRVAHAVMCDKVGSLSHPPARKVYLGDAPRPPSTGFAPLKPTEKNRVQLIEAHAQTKITPTALWDGYDLSVCFAEDPKL